MSPLRIMQRQNPDQPRDRARVQVRPPGLHRLRPPLHRDLFIFGCVTQLKHLPNTTPLTESTTMPDQHQNDELSFRVKSDLFSLGYVCGNTGRTPAEIIEAAAKLGLHPIAIDRVPYFNNAEADQLQAFIRDGRAGAPVSPLPTAEHYRLADELEPLDLLELIMKADDQVDRLRHATALGIAAGRRHDPSTGADAERFISDVAGVVAGDMEAARRCYDWIVQHANESADA